MAILVDYSAIAMATVYVGLKEFAEPSEDILRHLILNSLRSYNVKYGKRFGDLVLAIDSRHYWRKDVFPFYKWKRRVDRDKDHEESDVNWDDIYTWIHNIKSDIKEYFPYRVIEAHGAEGDDVIGTICKHYHLVEKMLIVARDGDYKQLQQFKHVAQYDPILEKIIKVDNPRRYLSEHIIRGDRGDGICNILSPNDSFYTGTRQKACGAKKIVDWIGKDPKDFCETPEALARYKENEKLIDLTKCPDDIVDDIIKQYDAGTPNDSSQIHKYLMMNRMTLMLEVYNDFKPYRDK